MILTMQNSNQPVPLSHSITELQQIILQLTVDGNSIEEIAAMLKINELKVELFQFMLMKKFRVESKSQMVMIALEHGLAS